MTHSTRNRPGDAGPAARSGQGRVLLLAQTTGYQTRMFAAAAERLGIELLYATDRCDQIDDPWGDAAIAVRFSEEWRSVDALLKVIDQRPIAGVLAVGDRPTVLAAQVTKLLHLPGHPPEAAAAARDKRVARARFAEAGLLVPASFAVPMSVDPLTVLPRVSFPAVIKPTVLSGSRGVIRADDALSFALGFDRIRRLLLSPAVRELREAEADVIQVEEYIPGAEFAIEGLLDRGALTPLAIFDKPDPLEGPFFEETIYVTPSRVNTGIQQQMVAVVARAVEALGLHHGPIHAECRVNSKGVYVLEIAARPIGGLCAKVLRFARPSTRFPDARAGNLAQGRDGGERIGFEELLLRHAAGEAAGGWRREADAAAVMMIPIPRSGIFRRVDGIESAAALPHVDEIQITAKPDQQLLALPEGASYLGFIFARAATAAEAEAAVRAAHAALRITIDPLLQMHV